MQARHCASHPHNFELYIMKALNKTKQAMQDIQMSNMTTVIHNIFINANKNGYYSNTNGVLIAVQEGNEQIRKFSNRFSVEFQRACKSNDLLFTDGLKNGNSINQHNLSTNKYGMRTKSAKTLFHKEAKNGTPTFHSFVKKAAEKAEGRAQVM